jgi:ABC-type lipoprotein export system ATPase subunit
MNPEPVLQLERVSKIYRASPPVAALRGVSLTLGRGGFCLITGPSGSGKTTLLGIAGGLEAPTEGRVRICGEDVTGRGRGSLIALRRRHVGFIFQDFRLIDLLTAEENVALALRLRGVKRGAARSRSRETLVRLGLGEKRGSRPPQLSGGEKQRVAIARALAGAPTLLLADEPTANLDTETGYQVIRLLRQLASQQGATVLVASHDPRLAAHADRIVHLVDGAIAGEEAAS